MIAPIIVDLQLNINMELFFKQVLLLFVLLNPFFLSIYLIDIIHELKSQHFFQVTFRASLISSVVFIFFAIFGDFFFRYIIQARFASFLIFGGIVFLIIALKFVSSGVEAMRVFRGKPEYLESSIAMPFMIGPGTVSASIVIGNNLTKYNAVFAILTAMGLTVFCLGIFKLIFDHLKKNNERLIARYLDIVGRSMALITGTIAVEMIVKGIEKIFISTQ